MKIEDLFDAEAKLRMAARDYSSAEHTEQSIGYRRQRSKELRQAARDYSGLAERFEIAIGKEIADMAATETEP